MRGSEFSWFERFSRRYFHRITVTIKMELPGILRKLHQRKQRLFGAGSERKIGNNADFGR